MNEPLEVISLAIHFDSFVFNADFIDEAMGREWVIRTLTDLLDRYTITGASKIEVRRS